MNTQFLLPITQTSDAFASDVWQQVIQQKFPIVMNSNNYEGSPYVFGFIAFSKLLINFSLWLYHLSKQKNINKLYFLSRDGKILYDYFNKLFFKSDIETVYIYCSRRALKSISIYDEKDIISYLNQFRSLEHFTIRSLLDYLCNLQINDQVSTTFLNYGFTNVDEKLILTSQQREHFLQACLKIKELIITSSAKYRNHYISYLNENNFNKDSSNAAVIDIGYECSAQATFAKLLNNPEIHGFYLGTFQEALYKISNLYYADSYLFNFASRNENPYQFVSNVELVETLMCDYNDSFIRIECQNNYLQPVFFTDESIDNTSRHKIKEIHRGALEFADLLTRHFSTQVLTHLKPSSPDIAFDLLSDFISKPSQKNDVRIFEGIKFSYDSIHDLSRYIIAPKKNPCDISKTISLWIEGEKLLNQHSRPQIAKIQQMSLKLEQCILQPLLNDRLKRKYLNNRWLFFADSKSKSFRLYFRHLGQYF